MAAISPEGINTFGAYFAWLESSRNNEIGVIDDGKYGGERYRTTTEGRSSILRIFPTWIMCFESEWRSRMQAVQRYSEALHTADDTDS